MSNLFRLSLILALVFSGAKVFGYESKELNAPSHRKTDVVTTSNQSNTAPASRYQVSGDRQGKVTVTDKVTGQEIRTFQMDVGVVVRETFILDNGRTVAAAQKDHTIFWDLATGNEINRFPARIYGFSHDQKKFFIHLYPEGVYLYAYPALTLICPLLEEGTFGPGYFQFSPDDRFLIIKFVTGLPASDEDYPWGGIVDRGVIMTQLFDLQKCREIKEFYALKVTGPIEFSPDSKFLYIRDDFIFMTDRFLRGSWQFNLMNYKIESLVD